MNRRGAVLPLLRNSLQVEWVPERTWVYRRTFRVDASPATRRATLVFEGIDYEAEVFLNGEVIGTHRGMFTRATLDATDLLRLDRENVVVVAIAPALEEEQQVGRTERVRTHKAPPGSLSTSRSTDGASAKSRRRS